MGTASPTASIWLESTTCFGTIVRASRQNFQLGTYPWVMINGAQVTAASPVTDWLQDAPRAVDGMAKTLTANSTTPSALVVPQGGVAKQPITFNSTNTSITTMAGAAGNQFISVFLGCADSKTTLVHDATGAVQDGFFLTAKGNLSLTIGLTYQLMSNGTQWRQVT